MTDQVTTSAIVVATPDIAAFLLPAYSVCTFFNLALSALSPFAAKYDLDVDFEMDLFNIYYRSRKSCEGCSYNAQLSSTVVVQFCQTTESTALAAKL